MSPSEIYLILKLDAIGGFLITMVVLASLGIVATIIGQIVHVCGSCQGCKMIPKKGQLGRLYWLVPTLLFFIVGTTLVPSTNQMLMIHVIPAVYKDGDISKIRDELGDGYQILKDYLRSKIETPSAPIIEPPVPSPTSDSSEHPAEPE